MQIAARHFINPLAAIVTLAVGIAVVAVTNRVASLFISPSVVANEAPPLVMPSDKSIPSSPEKVGLSCYDLSILPIWQELKRDAEFQRVMGITEGYTDCSDLLEVRRIDLNKDGSGEYLVKGKDRFCGATSNCDFWIFEVKKSRASKLLASGGINVDVSSSTSHGFRNVVFRIDGSSYPDSLEEYRFDGSEYRLARCFQQDKQTLEKWDESCDGSADVSAQEPQEHGPEKDWLDYEPAVVELEGKLTVKTYFGPPNFGENPESDSKEKEWILVLDKPISVRGRTDPDAGYDDTSVENVREMELVLLGSHTDLKGKKVIVTGTLFHAFTGHHHTDVLADVQSISLAAPRKGSSLTRQPSINIRHPLRQT